MCGVLKLVAVLLLAVILLPLFFTLVCALSPESSWIDMADALAGVLPFGHFLYALVTGVMGALFASDAAHILVNGAQYIPSGVALWNEIMKAILVTVIFAVATKLFSVILTRKNRGFCERTADFLFQVLFSFMAVWLSSSIMDFYTIQVEQLEDTVQYLFTTLASFIIVSGGVAVMVVLAHVLVIGVAAFVLRAVLLNVLKIVLTYLACFAFLTACIRADALFAAPAIALIWLALMALLVYLDGKLEESM